MSRGLVCVGGRFYWVKRVPVRFRGVVLGRDGRPVGQVRQSLFTDSRREAVAKASLVEASRIAEWEALASGDASAAAGHRRAAARVAEVSGLSFQAMRAALEGSDTGSRPLERAATAEPALPKRVPSARPALPSLPEVFEAYVELTTTRHLAKSARQQHLWRLPRERAVRNFLAVCAPTRRDWPVSEITRSDALKFRRWWADRVAGGMKAETANKDFTHLAEVLGTWARLTETEIANPFRGLRFEPQAVGTRPPFSPSWIGARLLAPGAFDGLNAEARDVFLVLVNTGARPSEVTDAPLSDLVLDAEIPFLRIAPHGRALKVRHTAREIPLLGVSLDAARRLVAAGGPIRYRFKAGHWSAVVNKYLGSNGLKETPKHVAYSLRHSFEDALLAAGVDDRIRADILGHKYNRPTYGTGGALAGRRSAIAKVAW
ncbi:MAG: integrase [Pseudomonadota bacterium]